MKLEVPDGLVEFLQRKKMELRAAAPADRQCDITIETVLLGYAELGRRHENAARERVQQSLRERDA